MKNLILLSIIVTALFFQSCSQGHNTAPAVDTVFTKTCYIAVDGKDTAKLTLKTFSKGAKGKLLFNFYKKDKNDGAITGVFKGDTLLVDYGFQVGNKKSWYRNPLAFLKKDGKLYMGVGKMETTMGKTYFRKDVPIDFEGGRFIFEPADCR